ncbi:MAG: (d)CMP kinase [Candidatus Woesearchaeota archaeon]
MIISICGMSGSGKSNVAKLLAEKLGMKHYSIGDIRRNMAIERNITLKRLNDVGEHQKFTDKQADDKCFKLGKEEANFVIDGRLVYHFIPESVKIFLKSHLRIRAEKAYIDEKKMEEFRDLGDAIAALIGREKSDQYRFKKYYEIDCNNELQYDLIINTDYLSFEEVVDKVIEFLKKESILKEVA